MKLDRFVTAECYRGKWPGTKDTTALEEIVTQDRKGKGCFLPYVPGETFKAGEHREERQFRREETRRNVRIFWVSFLTLLAAIGAVVATCSMDATRDVVPPPAPEAGLVPRTTPLDDAKAV